MLPKNGSKRSSPSASEMAQDKRRKELSGQFHFRDDLHKPDVIEKLAIAWNSKVGDKSFLSGEAEVMSHPFSCCVIKNFIKPQDESEMNLSELITDLNELELTEKNNDLYKFKQSQDLFQSDIPTVAALKDFLVGQVKPWLQKVTGISDLSDTVDIFCAKYGHTDHLLCHDDKLEGRRIAYILYLVPEDWSAEDGGSLDLFYSDRGEPTKIAKSILPARNSFAFFEVTPISYHQVAEVLSKTKVRLSITGWFHGPTPLRQDTYDEPKLMAPKDIGEQEFFSWINPIYLDPVNQSEINEKFEDSSEISLPDFLVPGKYQEVAQALSSIDKEWLRLGPPNKRCYDVLKIPDNIPSFKIENPAVEKIKECVDFLRSDALCLVLSTLTGLRLHHLAETHEAENGATPKEECDGGIQVLPPDSTTKKLGKDPKKMKGFTSKDKPDTLPGTPRGDAGKAPMLFVDNMEVVKSALEAKCSEEDSWSNASTFGDSESRCSIRTEPDFQDTNLSKQALKKLDKKQAEEKTLPESGASFATNDDNWSTAATIGENVEPVALVRAEVRRWRRGGYSLLYDDDGSEMKTSTLDARLFFNCPKDWDLNWGGFSSYAAKNEDEELLTAPPVPNTLSLVYKDSETFGFVKYVNSAIPKEFHDIALTYIEQLPDE